MLKFKFKLEISIDNCEVQILVVFFQALVLAAEKHFGFVLSHAILSQQGLRRVLVLPTDAAEGEQEGCCSDIRRSLQQGFKPRSIHTFNSSHAA